MKNTIIELSSLYNKPFCGFCISLRKTTNIISKWSPAANCEKQCYTELRKISKHEIRIKQSYVIDMYKKFYVKKNKNKKSNIR